MTQPKTNRIPAPVYAAAGAGELAFQQLRKLPTVVTELGNRVVADGTKVVTELGGRAVVTGVELRQKATETFRTANLTASGLRDRATPAELNLDKLRTELSLDKLRTELDLDKLRAELDLDKLRGAATRNAAVVLAGAHAAQERALAAYGALIARGERVVGAGVLEAADTVNADIEATDATVAAEVRAVAAPDRTPTPTEVARAGAEHPPTPADVAEVVGAKPAAAGTTRRRATKAAAKPTAAAKAAAKPTAAGTAKAPKATKRTRPTAE
ncbi:hypothetical protein [Micromonospora rifamycinica]|uniref:Uncharacterized protein n=1 Tax=Micromonospora rifamycinica TaxID=291594 RepID=A0A109II58_9ACTN|nr:hypothetical protein [Micromonospora rifamycinica]KWV30983.1 hypothetical protein AWV63_20005 [Micromonospora rifamycinica]SCG77935.1 hypothetical protein GA0070623_4318 [Micromonospora rifamycinica]